MKTLFSLFALLVAGLAFTGPAYAHCQIPCGIFDDAREFDAMAENVRTMERSIEGIMAADPATRDGLHTIARWTANKEAHGDKIIHAAQYYFLAQRVKKPAEASGDAYQMYLGHLEKLHDVTVAAMRAKQSTDLARIEALRAAVAAYRTHYFAEHGHEH